MSMNKTKTFVRPYQKSESGMLWAKNEKILQKKMILPILFLKKYLTNDIVCGIIFRRYGGIAQLARAIGSYPIGRGFKSNFRYQPF